MLVGLFLVLAGLLPVIGLLLLVLGAFGGWMYSLRPLALAWCGWGEVDNAILGGMLLPAFGFAVQSSEINPSIFLLALPFGLHAFVNLLATTWADRKADQQVGKYTLATRWPVKRLRWLYFLAILMAYGLLFSFRGWLMPDPIVWSLILVLPLAIWAGRVYTRQHSPFPSVMVMVIFLLVQLMGWSILALLS